MASRSRQEPIEGILIVNGERYRVELGSMSHSYPPIYNFRVIETESKGLPWEPSATFVKEFKPLIQYASTQEPALFTTGAGPDVTAALEYDDLPSHTFSSTIVPLNAAEGCRMGQCWKELIPNRFQSANRRVQYDYRGGRLFPVGVSTSL